MHGLFLWKIKKEIQLLIRFKKFEKNLIANQTEIHKLHDIVNDYKNTYHSTIKMKFVDVKSNANINSSINVKDPKFRIGNIARI